MWGVGIELGLMPGSQRDRVLANVDSWKSKSTGRSRFGCAKESQGSMSITTFQGTAGYVTRMSGGVGGAVRLLPIPIKFHEMRRDFVLRVNRKYAILPI